MKEETVQTKYTKSSTKIIHITPLCKNKVCLMTNRMGGHCELCNCLPKYTCYTILEQNNYALYKQNVLKSQYWQVVIVTCKSCIHRLSHN